MSGVSPLESAAVESSPHGPLSKTADSSPILQVFEPQRSRLRVNWRELWHYRELLFFLAWRDIKVRYKQTALGMLWAVLQPVLTMLVFSLIFGRLAGLGRRLPANVPYPLYVYAGLILWLFFSHAVASSGASLVGSANLITKVYFPRMIIPLAPVGVTLVDFLISSVVLAGMMIVYGISPGTEVVLAPLFVGGAMLAAVGVGAFLAAATATYRDFRYVIPFMLQIWMFSTPVIYPAAIIPERFRWLLPLNPMAGLIEGFRAALLGQPLNVPHIATSMAVALIAFFGGAMYFKSVERRLADII
jgi:lipopolysaccharide transport system permease protein